jgi:hypothetical protein
MKKALVGIISVLFFSSLFLYWRFNYPNNETIAEQFKELKPTAEFVDAEMIFDWEPRKVVTYIVKYKHPSSDEILTDDFSLKQHWNFRWYWCSDQTERKCD